MRLSLIVGLLVSVVGRAAAQSTETPVPFDSAQRVLAVTPPLAARLRLAAPVWPVQGEFRDARLYAVEPAGGFVLVVQRPSGAVQRYLLTEAQRATLRSTIDAAMMVSGRPSGDAASDVLSEPAGNSLARRQTLLAALVYGPLAASLADDPSVAGALYLLVTGGTFFASYSAAQSSGITRAQDHLASHLGLAAATAGYLFGYSATDNSGRGVRAIALGSAIAGTAAGLSLGRGLSDAEAHSATAGVEATALLSWAAAESFGVSDRGVAAIVGASEFVGFPIGLSYPRRASYTVTAGDVGAAGTAGLVGALITSTTLGKDPDRRVAFGVAGLGYLGGLVVGDLAIARRFDLTQSEANIAGVGAIAGGLVGLAIPVLSGSDDPRFTFGAAALGATLGMAAIVGQSPHRVDGSAVTRTGARSAAPPGRFGIELGGPALLGALSGVPGRYSILHVSF